jgi:hypothetical protein
MNHWTVIPYKLTYQKGRFYACIYFYGSRDQTEAGEQTKVFLEPGDITQEYFPNPKIVLFH